IGTVPTGTGEFRRIHSRVAWMSEPVDRSMIVSAPQRVAHTIFSTSSAIELVTAELPMLALILVAKRLPMIIGSLSGWRWLAGMTARPAATSSRTSSTSTPSRAAMNRISGVMRPARAHASCVRTRGGDPGAVVADGDECDDDDVTGDADTDAGTGPGCGHSSRVRGSPVARSWHCSAEAYPV